MYADTLLNPSAEANALQSMEFTFIRGAEYAVGKLPFVSVFHAAKSETRALIDRLFLLKKTFALGYVRHVLLLVWIPGGVGHPATALQEEPLCTKLPVAHVRSVRAPDAQLHAGGVFQLEGAALLGHRAQLGSVRLGKRVRRQVVPEHAICQQSLPLVRIYSFYIVSSHPVSR